MGTYDGRVRLVNPATGKTRWETQSYPSRVTRVVHNVAMPPDGRFVASVNVSQENWKLWDAASGVVCMTSARHDGTGACVCSMTSSGRRESLDEGCPVQAHTAGLLAVAYSPCGHTLATGGEDGAVILWNAGTGKAKHILLGHNGRVSKVRCVTFSVEGTRLASGSYDCSIRVWDTKMGVLLRTIQHAHEGDVSWVQFCPTDSTILASTQLGNKRLNLWHVESGERKSSFVGNRFAVFSPGGRTIATPRTAGASAVQLINVNSGEPTLIMVGHALPVYSIVFSSDGSKLASGSVDGSCKVWDSSTGVLLVTIPGDKAICSVAWGRDWVLDTQRVVAFVMGHHPRLGAGSRVPRLDEELLRMILNLV